MENLGRLIEITDIRTIWADEAKDFTPWLAKPENMSILSETLGIDLSVDDTEVSVGDFRADIVAYETDTDEKDFAKVSIDRGTKDYEMLMPWSRVFLLNKSFTTFSGSVNSRALLFPMETVYESYVAQQIRKAFSPDGWRVKTQDRGYYLFTLRNSLTIRTGSRRDAGRKTERQ